MAGVASRQWGYGAGVLSGFKLSLAAGCALVGLIIGLRGGSSAGGYGAEDEDIPWEVREPSGKVLRALFPVFWAAEQERADDPTARM